MTISWIHIDYHKFYGLISLTQLYPWIVKIISEKTQRLFWGNVLICMVFLVLQSDNMTDKWHVYMTKDGRISLAGLSAAKCEYLADAIIDSYHNVS